MDSELADDIVFKEYRDLDPVSRSPEQYFVAIIHLTAAVIISVIQFTYGFNSWALGFGIVTPILLILQGFAYLVIRNDLWYREQMVPFILSILMATEIETDRYLRYHRRFIRFTLILGWFVILVCQFTWTFGLTEIMPLFAGDDFLLRFIGELVAYAVLFGPFLLYGLGLVAILTILERILKTRYKDINHLFDIENKWTAETHRRSKNPESIRKGNSPMDSWELE